jgi:hypothetical protein
MGIELEVLEVAVPGGSGAGADAWYGEMLDDKH